MGTLDAIFPATRIAVLKQLYLQPRKSFHLRELVRLLGKGTGGVQRELDRLEQAQLVRCLFEDRLKTYKANTESPFFPELRSMLLKAGRW